MDRAGCRKSGPLDRLMEANLGSFKDRFGLGYLGPTGPSGPTSPTGPTGPAGAPERSGGSVGYNRAVNYIDDALLAYSLRLLQALQETPEKRARLFDLAAKVSARVEVLSGVTKELIVKGYLSKLEEDRVGNDLLQLTPAGKDFLEKF